MNKDTYLTYFEANRTAILDAAALGLDPPIKGCPGWDVAQLIGHMGGVYTFWLKWVRERPRGHSPEAYRELCAEREARLPGYEAWKDAGFAAEARPSGIMDFARETGDELGSHLRELRPDEYVWTFVPSWQNGSFVFRRVAQETGVHAWDAQQAHDREQPIETALALDGVDEMLNALPQISTMSKDRPNLRSGQRIRFEEAGGAKTWLVSFPVEAMTVIEDDDLAVDTTIKASASDILLFTVGRRTVDELEATGDLELARQWGDLAGRF